MQVVERLVGNDARRHIHDVALGDGFGLGVGVERLAEQRDGGGSRRGGESDEELIQVMLADDLGDLFFRGPASGVFGVWLVRLAERQADGRAHLAFLRAVGFIDEERHAQLLQSGFFLNLLQHPGELLLRGDDDRLPLFEKARQIVRLLREAHHVLQMRELLDVFPDIRIERFPVGEDEDQIHQLLVRARLEQAVQPVGQPADGQRLAAAGGMVDEILLRRCHPSRRNGRDVIGHFPHHAALVIAGEDGEGRALRLILFCLALRARGRGRTTAPRATAP